MNSFEYEEARSRLLALMSYTSNDLENRATCMHEYIRGSIDGLRIAVEILDSSFKLNQGDGRNASHQK